MKKSVRRLAFGALAAAAAVQFAACRNRPETVYGPPEAFTKEDPSNNVPEVVYGPPGMFGIDETEETPVTPADPGEETETGTEEIIFPETEFIPGDNIVECLYGPPEMLETYQQDTGFVPAENEPVDVYGPPSMFGIDDAEEAPSDEPETAAAETSEAESPETEAQK